MLTASAPAWQRELFERRTLGVHLGLDVIRAAYERLDGPARRIPAVHIVGTNGKGSTAAMVAHGLQGAGRRVGLFTSPHLHRLGERIRIAGEPLDDPTVGRWIDRVIEVERRNDLGGTLTFFELLTLAALLAFADAKVDIAVVECGLGGRLDATRVANSKLTLVTPIALDHQRFLGPDLESIAAEKAAVLENRAPALSVSQEVGAVAVLRAAAERWQTSLRFVGPALRAPLGLPGEHQRQNAGLAQAALEHLLGQASMEQIDGVCWPGRLERIEHDGGYMLFDVAHNPHGIAALCRYLAATPGPAGGRLIVFGSMLGKEAPVMVRELATLGDPLLLVPPADRQGWAPARLQTEVGASVSVSTAVAFDAPQATVLMRDRLAAGGEVVICGSCYLVGAIRGQVLGENADLVRLSDPLPRVSSPG